MRLKINNFFVFILSPIFLSTYLYYKEGPLILNPKKLLKSDGLLKDYVEFYVKFWNTFT